MIFSISSALFIFFFGIKVWNGLIHYSTSPTMKSTSRPTSSPTELDSDGDSTSTVSSTLTLGIAHNKTVTFENILAFLSLNLSVARDSLPPLSSSLVPDAALINELPLYLSNDFVNTSLIHITVVKVRLNVTFREFEGSDYRLPGELSCRGPPYASGRVRSP